jgi:hypothetical protein
VQSGHIQRLAGGFYRNTLAELPLNHLELLANWLRPMDWFYLSLECALHEVKAKFTPLNRILECVSLGLFYWSANRWTESSSSFNQRRSVYPEISIIMSSHENHSLLQKIEDLISAEKVAFKRHCVLRMRQRSISVDEFKEAMLHAEIVENYEDDYPFPSSLILGFTASQRPLHAVIAMDQKSDFLWIITLYEPTVQNWEADFKKRRG